jgi:tRNA A-37 threonylcarbamoyl transferase component Bud32
MDLLYLIDFGLAKNSEAAELDSILNSPVLRN